MLDPICRIARFVQQDRAYRAHGAAQLRMQIDGNSPRSSLRWFDTFPFLHDPALQRGGHRFAGKGGQDATLVVGVRPDFDGAVRFQREMIPELLLERKSEHGDRCCNETPPDDRERRERRLQRLAVLWLKPWTNPPRILKVLVQGGGELGEERAALTAGVRSGLTTLPGLPKSDCILWPDHAVRVQTNYAHLASLGSSL